MTSIKRSCGYIQLGLIALASLPSIVNAADCGGATTPNVVSIPFKYNVVEGKGRWITLAATSTDIEWQQLNQGWPKRYKPFKYGGEGAIDQWILESVTSHGVLFENGSVLAAGDVVNDPDDLFYQPEAGYTGSDNFVYCAQGSLGKSDTAEVNLVVSDPANYPMPIGIPNPGFGIDETPPADPSAWPGSEAAGYFYIDSDHPSCDDSNTYGYPNQPRCTIANNSTVAAGAKMVLADSDSPYPLRTGQSWHQIILEGTPSQTTWIVGNEFGPIKPRITLGISNKQELRIGGTGNYRISGIDVDGPNISNRGSAVNIVARYLRTRNFPSTSGGGTTLALNESDAENVLMFHVNANDNGIVSATFAEERDIHAFVGRNQKNFWMLDILCSENAGDCVQLTNNNTTENVYVGRATMHSMMENCIDFKDFNKFVVSESDCWDLRRVSYSSGSGGNAQNFYVNDEGNQQGYGYFINNRSWDTSGDNFSSANIGGRVYFIGNIAFFSPAGTGLDSAGGGGERHYYLNTVLDASDGMNFYTTGSAGGRYIAGNYIHSANRYGSALVAAHNVVSTHDYNAYGPDDLTFAWGSNSSPNTGSFGEFVTRTVDDGNSVVGVESRFVNASKLDFRLTESSELIDLIPPNTFATIAPGLNDIGSDLGIPILIDRNGVQRPQGTAYDIGATEFDSGMTIGVCPIPEPRTLITNSF